MIEFLSENTMGVINLVGLLVLWVQTALQDKKIDQDELKELAALILDGVLDYLKVDNPNSKE